MQPLTCKRQVQPNKPEGIFKNGLVRNGASGCSTPQTPRQGSTAPLPSASRDVVHALPWILVFEKAALAVDWIANWETLQGGCASSQLDHGYPKIDNFLYR